jgi:hypothetical protein
MKNLINCKVTNISMLDSIKESTCDRFEIDLKSDLEPNLRKKAMLKIVELWLLDQQYAGLTEEDLGAYDYLPDPWDPKKVQEREDLDDNLHCADVIFMGEEVLSWSVLYQIQPGHLMRFYFS